VRSAAYPVLKQVLLDYIMRDGVSHALDMFTVARRGLLVETSGARGDVVKLLPPLTISDDELDEGLDIIRTCVSAVLARAR